MHLRTKVRQFRSKLKNTKIPTRTISKYLLRIRALIESLQAIGDPVTDQDHIDMILEGLPKEYNSLVMMIYARGNPPSVDDIEALLFMKDAQFEKFQQELPSHAVTVNVAQASNMLESPFATDFNQNNGGFLGGYHGRGGRGRGCGGHGRGGSKPTCQLCDRYGHDAYH